MTSFDPDLEVDARALPSPGPGAFDRRPAGPSFGAACAELELLERGEWARLLREAAKLRLVKGRFSGRFAVLDTPPMAVEALRLCAGEQIERAPVARADEQRARALLATCLDEALGVWPSVGALAGAALRLDGGEVGRLRWAWALCATGRPQRALDWLGPTRAKAASQSVEFAMRATEAIALAQAEFPQRAISRISWLCGGAGGEDGRSDARATAFWVWALHLTHAQRCWHLRDRVAARADRVWLHAPHWRGLFERCARAVGPWVRLEDSRSFPTPSTRWLAHWSAARSA